LKDRQRDAPHSAARFLFRQRIIHDPMAKEFSALKAPAIALARLIARIERSRARLAPASRVCAKAMAAARRDDDWSAVEKLALAGEPFVFGSWKEAKATIQTWAGSAPCRLCQTLAEAPVAVGDHKASREGGLWEPDTPDEPQWRQEQRETMADRLLLLSRGVGWAALAQGDELSASRALGRIHEPGRWESEACDALFGPQANEAEARAAAQRIASLAIEPCQDAYRKALRQRVRAAPRHGAEKNKSHHGEIKEHVVARLERIERGVVMAIGEPLAQAGRGVAFGALWSEAARRRLLPLLRDEGGLAERRIDQDWARAWRRLERNGDAAREACFFGALAAISPMTKDPKSGAATLSPASDLAQEIWAFGEKCWGRKAAARAWPRNVDAKGLNAQIFALKEALAVEEALAGGGNADVAGTGEGAPTQERANACARKAARL
jgi:hypothetical protein